VDGAPTTGVYSASVTTLRPEPATLRDIPALVGARTAIVRAGALGLGGFVALAFGDFSSSLLAHATDWLLALFATLLLITGSAMAWTLVALRACEGHLAKLSDADRRCDYRRARAGYAQIGDSADPDALRSLGGFEISGHALSLADVYGAATLGYRAAVLLTLTTICVFLGAVWWSVAAS
jgi:hypothetical protein